MENKTVMYLDEKCTVVVNEEQKMIYLVCEDGEPMATCTSHISDLKNDEFAIKDYSENHGMYDCLRQGGIIEPKHLTVRSGWVSFPVVRLVK